MSAARDVQRARQPPANISSHICSIFARSARRRVADLVNEFADLL